MSDLFTDKIKLAIRSCQFHIQGIIPYPLLEEISVSLFNLQTKGILIELIILMDNEIKSIKTTNILLRISAAGGQIFTILRDSIISKLKNCGNTYHSLKRMPRNIVLCIKRMGKNWR